MSTVKYHSIDIKIEKGKKVKEFLYRDIKCMMVRSGGYWVGMYLMENNKEELYTYTIHPTSPNKVACVYAICYEIDDYYKERETTGKP